MKLKPVHIVPFRLNNIGDFIDRDHPVLFPESPKYGEYWTERARRCVEGHWGYDFDIGKGGWRYMPGNLYFYTNFFPILHEGDQGTEFSGFPLLRDIDWMQFYAYMECDGFAGFADDDVYTCFRPIGKLERGEQISNKEKKLIDRYGQYLYNKKGKLKKYIDAKEYLYQTFPEPLGLPLILNEARNIVFLSSRAVGKDLWEESTIFTEAGPKKIKEAKVGDRIYGADGKLTTIMDVAKYTNQMQYEVEFDDGRVVTCGDGHLWEVTLPGGNGPIVLPLKEIRKRYKGYYRASSGTTDKNIFVKIGEPVKFPDRELPIDPYFLGLWVGDGSASRVEITTMDDEIGEYVRVVANSFGCDVSVFDVPATGKAKIYKIVRTNTDRHPINAIFTKLNLFNNKHIPDVYLYASEEQRLSLLQGLLDTDGSVGANGHIEFVTKYEHLGEQVMLLARSLGIKAKRSVREISFMRDPNTGNIIEFDTPRNYYRIRLHTGMPVFRLRRKLSRIIANPKAAVTIANRKRNAIVDIRPVGVRPSVCIGVDNSDNLFLTDNYVVTHNSYGVAGGVVTYDFTFNGARTFYDYSEKKTSTTVVVGAGVSTKSKEFLDKVASGYDFLRTSVGAFSDGQYTESGCFWRPYEGSLSLNNAITNRVKTKGGKGYDGPGSKIVHVSYQQSASAGVGYRARRMVVEECFAKGTLVRMADNSVKPIESIVIGDFVLTPGGGRAAVGRTTSGVDDMYLVTQKYGQSYIVNSKHLLYLDQRCHTRSIKDDGVKTIKAEDFNQDIIGKYRLRTTHGVQSGPVEFESSSEPLLDPYFVGSYIGDGVVRSCAIVFNTHKDAETLDWFENQFCKKYFLKAVRYKTNTDKAVIVAGVKEKNGDFYRHPVKELLKHYGIFEKKEIPEDYLTAPIKDRLQLLAGIIDTDGNVSVNEKKTSFSYEVSVSSREKLANQILFLAKSLGFRASMSVKKSNKGFGEKIVKERRKYVIRIRGDVWTIPVKLPYKKIKKYEWVSDWRRTPISVQKIGRGEYFGITLDSANPLFLLEDYTVVHNCGLLEKFTQVHAENSATQRRETKMGYTIYLGTGGDIDKIRQIRDAFYNPESYDCVSFPDIFNGTGKPIGMFIPAYYRSALFKDENGNTDVKAAFDDEMMERDKKRKEGSKAYEGHIISYPILPQEMFMQSGGNAFPTDLIEARINELEISGEYKKYSVGHIHYVSMKNDLCEWKEDTKKELRPILRFGDEDNMHDKRGAIVIYEHPPDDKPKPTYTNPLFLVVYDPVAKDGIGTSLCSVLVFKTWYLDDLTTIQFNVVAEWIGRHERQDDNHEMAFRLAAYYGAKILPEINNTDILRYARMTNRYHWLQPRPGLALSGMVDQKSNYDVGIKISPTMIPHLEAAGVELLTTSIDKSIFIDGADEMVVDTKMVSKMRSMRLLEELLYYNRDDNFDHVSAMFLIAVWIRQQKLQPVQYAAMQNIEKDSLELKALFSPRPTNTPHPAFNY